MAATLHLELVSPERLLVSEPVEMVVVPGTEGVFGVMPQHMLLVSTLQPGVVDVYNGGAIAERYFITGGFAEVTGESCTLLVDEALPLATLTRAYVTERLTQARARIEIAVTEEETRRASELVVHAELMAEYANG